MYENEEIRRQLEQQILLIYSVFILLMAVSAVVLNWGIWVAIIILAGAACSWWCVITQYATYRFRSFFVTGMSLMSFLIYGFKVDDFWGMMLPMAVLFVLLSFYGISEIMGLTIAVFFVLMFYHLLVIHSVEMPVNHQERIHRLFQGLSLLTVEGLTYRFVKKQKSIQKQLSETIETLKKAEKSKDNFLSNVSHEIRTPISTICGISDILRGEQLPDRIREDMDHIYSAGHHLLMVVSDILDFTELQTGTLTVTEEPYDLASVLNDVMNMSMSYNEKGLDIRLKCEGELPSSLLGDEQKIKRVILNLMGNAIKFTEKGNVLLKVQARKETYGVNLAISVRDTGIGMEPQQVEKLFGMFNQADTASNRMTEGLGLGLMISQRIVRKMGGFLTVRSEYGRGSEFQFVIPQQVLDSTPVHDMNFDREKVFRPDFCSPETRTLVVDDNEMNLKVIRGLLAPYRMQVYTAEGGEEALRIIGEMEFDFVFMDHMMPGMDGIETLRNIRKKPGVYYQNVPVIALTANAVGGAREMFLSEGFQDYLTKPVDLSDLNRVLKKYIPPYKKIELAGLTKLETEPAAEENETAQRPEVSLDGLDMQLGVSYYGGNWEDYLEIVDFFAENSSQNRKKLQSFYEKGDLENYTILVHSLKSNARGIGAVSLSERAAQLEAAGKEKDRDFIGKNHGVMMDHYRELTEGIKEKRKKEKKEEGAAAPHMPLQEISKEALLDMLQELRENLETFETEGIRQTTENFVQYSFRGEPLSHSLETVLKKTEEFDYVGAEEALEEWVNTQEGELV